MPRRTRLVLLPLAAAAAVLIADVVVVGLTILLVGKLP
jgi:hypothetical protein